MSPEPLAWSGFAVFATLSDGLWLTGTVTVEVVLVIGPPAEGGGVPVAVAVLVSWEESASVWFNVYEAVQRISAPGTSGAGAGHVTVGGVLVPENDSSFTVMLLRVTLPVFVTLNSYVTVSPANPTIDLSAVLTISSAGLASTGLSTDDGGESTAGPLGGVPCAVAVLVISPRSTSA